MRMRKDLEADGIKIPAYTEVNGADVVWLSANEVNGAKYASANDNEASPAYAYEHIKLTDGREFFVCGVDLEA